MDTYEWTELDHLNARLRELQSEREAAAKNRIGLLRQIDDEILRAEGQRARLVTHLTHRLIHHVAA
jgi:predicted transcriptional regulator